MKLSIFQHRVSNSKLKQEKFNQDYVSKYPKTFQNIPNETVLVRNEVIYFNFRCSSSKKKIWC